MTIKPINLTEALASFDDVYSPRIVATINDYVVRVAHTLAEHIRHVHEDTDEFFLVLGGRFDVTLRDAVGHESTVCLVEGDTSSCPRAPSTSPRLPRQRLRGRRDFLRRRPRDRGVGGYGVPRAGR